MKSIKPLVLSFFIGVIAPCCAHATGEPISLSAAAASIDGTGAHLENSGADSDIGYWGNTAETISWITNVPSAGVYEISVTYAVPNSNAGSEVEVTVGDKAISGKIAGTSDNDWQTFKTIDFGNISVPQAGPVDVILAANQKPADYIMNVRSITLTPTNLLNPTTPSHPATRFKLSITPKNHGPAGTLNLWYQKPANAWVEALPVGNGRLGAMDFGGIDKEHLQLNEGTLWAGSPYDQDNTNAINVIPQARKLIFDGRPADAINLINAGAMSVPVKQMPYQTLGDLNLTFPVTDGKITDYQRSLDLSTAIATTTFKMGGVTYTREVFSSAPAQTIVVHLSADKPGSISFNAKLSSPQQNVVVCADGNALTVTGRSGDFQGITGQVIFHSRLIAKNEGGTVTATDDSLKVDGADSVTLLLSAATSYTSWNDVTGDPVARAKEPLEKAASLSYEDILNAHIADYQKLFNRVTFTLPLGPDSSLPTDQRLLNFDNGKDPQLAALFFQFGRYLLISCSRPGGQAATLQGLWNDSLTPPWESKYTININTEMNYWPAEPDNLSECAEPLFNLISDISQSGARTAKSMYGARGWVAHHNTDIWRATGPIDFAPTGMWPMGGAWLCTHLWEHYEFTGDKDFLKKAYPIMKGSCEFFFDTLVEHPKYHYLVTCPSYSPENGTQTAGPTMDNEILRDLFSETAEAAKILGLDQSFQDQAIATMNRLPPLKVGKGGQLQEWIEDLDSPDDHNRHVSHLYGLYPSSQINAKTPEFFKAARQSLLWRGDAGTGWSLAWKINFWARLLDGDHAFLILSNQLSLPGSHGQSFDTGGGTFPNLFDAHPPFQIDGNFGAVSGMTEMLLQSHTGQIDLLPALPSAWPEGQITGLRARGGFEISETWKAGKLTLATIKSINGTHAKVHYDSKTVDLKLAPGESVNLDAELIVHPAHAATVAADK